MSDYFQKYEQLEKFFNNNHLYLKHNIRRTIIEANNIAWCSGGISPYSASSELNIFQIADGKGYTIDEAILSAGMENYEKFCSLYSYCINPLIFHIYKEKNNNSFIFDVNEKLVSFQDITYDINIKTFLENTFTSIKEQQEYINIINDQTIYGIPYQTLNNSNIKYYNPNILYHINGDMGLGAGFSLQEALNHAICEIYSKYVCYQLYNNYQNQKFYYIPHSLLNEELQNIIQKIEERNNFCFIFDLSYNYNLPVILVLIYGKICTKIHFAFGSDIDFQIAVKKAILEAYHGLYHNGIIDKHQIPFRQLNNEKKAMSYLAAKEAQYVYTLPIQIIKYRHCIPEEILLNMEPIANYNQQYYNEDIFKYQKIYYHNYSLDNSLYAVHVYIPEFQFQYNLSEYINTFPVSYKEKNIKLVFNIYYTILNLLNHNNNTYDLIQDILQINQIEDIHMLKLLMQTDWLSPRIKENSQILFFIQDLLLNQPIDLTYVQDIYSKIIFLYYYHLKAFSKDNKYSKTELYKLFSFSAILNDRLEPDIIQDINNINDNQYLIFKTTFEPFLKEITEAFSALDIMIKTRINKKESDLKK